MDAIVRSLLNRLKGGYENLLKKPMNEEAYLDYLNWKNITPQEWQIMQPEFIELLESGKSFLRFNMLDLAREQLIDAFLIRPYDFEVNQQLALLYLKRYKNSLFDQDKRRAELHAKKGYSLNPNWEEGSKIIRKINLPSQKTKKQKSKQRQVAFNWGILFIIAVVLFIVDGIYDNYKRKHYEQYYLEQERDQKRKESYSDLTVRKSISVNFNKKNDNNIPIEARLVQSHYEYNPEKTKYYNRYDLLLFVKFPKQVPSTAILKYIAYNQSGNELETGKLFIDMPYEHTKVDEYYNIKKRIYLEDQLVDLDHLHIEIERLFPSRLNRPAETDKLLSLEWETKRPAGVDLQIFERYTSYMTSRSKKPYRYFSLVYKLVNKGSKSITKLNAKVRFYDKEGQLLTTDRLYLINNQIQLPPYFSYADRTSINTQLSQAEFDKIDHYKISISDIEQVDYQAPEIELIQ